MSKINHLISTANIHARASILIGKHRHAYTYCMHHVNQMGDARYPIIYDHQLLPKKRELSYFHLRLKAGFAVLWVDLDSRKCNKNAK